MSWQDFTRQVLRNEEPSVSITKLGRMAFNKAATLILRDENASHVVLMWDSELHRFGVRVAAPKASGAYKLSYADNGTSAGFSSVTFLNFIKYDWTATRSFVAEWDSKTKLFIVAVPLEHFGASGDRRQPLGKIKRSDRLKSETTVEPVEKEGQEELQLK